MSDVISWENYFMNLAILASLRSKDTTKVGSVLVLNHKVIGMGYNGLPTGIDESLFPTAREGDIHLTKYAYTLHSEQNCILNATVFDLTGASIYVTLFPCCNCAKIILQKGIKEVIYLEDKYHDLPEYIASRKLFDAMNIKIRQYSGDILIQK